MRFSRLIAPAVAAALVGGAPLHAQQGLASDGRLRSAAGPYGHAVSAMLVTAAIAGGGAPDHKLVLRANPETMHSVVPSIALYTASSLPTAATGGGTRVVRPETKVSMRWATHSPFSLEASAAYAKVSDGATATSRGTVSVVTAYQVGPRVSLYVEGLAYGRPGGGAIPAQYADAGVAVRLTDRLQLDVRGGRGLGGGAVGEHVVGIGLARRW